MPIEYAVQDLLHSDDFITLDNWHHEGIGSMAPLAGGGMRLDCHGSKQGAAGCMAFFRPTLFDQIAISYEILVHRQGGLVINYIAIRGLRGEDLIADAAHLAPRSGIMANYYATYWGLQSYHLSFSRFDDQGVHTQASNWRRNPGSVLVGHGNDPVQMLGQRYAIRLTKDEGFLQFFADGQFAHGVVDRDTGSGPIPDYGKFGFRLIGSAVRADIFNFRVYRIAKSHALRANHAAQRPIPGA